MFLTRDKNGAVIWGVFYTKASVEEHTRLPRIARIVVKRDKWRKAATGKGATHYCRRDAAVFVGVEEQTLVDWGLKFCVWLGGKPIKVFTAPDLRGEFYPLKKLQQIKKARRRAVRRRGAAHRVFCARTGWPIARKRPPATDPIIESARPPRGLE